MSDHHGDDIVGVMDATHGGTRYTLYGTPQELMRVARLMGLRPDEGTFDRKDDPKTDVTFHGDGDDTARFFPVLPAGDLIKQVETIAEQLGAAVGFID